MTKAQASIWLRRGLTTGLTGIAFWNSYQHTVDWFVDNGQAESAHMLALIPELGVILTVLILAGSRLTAGLKFIAWTFGLTSLGLTLTANAAGAGSGLMGLTAALVAPVFAVLGFALEVLSLQAEPELEPVSEPEPPAAELPLIPELPPVSLISEPPAAEPEPVREPVREPVPAAKVSRSVSRSTAAVGSGSGPRAQGYAWAQAQVDAGNPWPTAAQIRAQFPDMSPATSKRIKNPAASKTVVTVTDKEGVNA